MAQLLWLEWQRPLDGYQIVANDAGGMVLKAAGTRMLTYEPLQEAPALFRQFADIKPTKDAIRDFASQYGLPTKDDSCAIHSWYKRVERMRSAVELWEGGKKSCDLTEFQECFSKGPRGISSIMLRKDPVSNRLNLSIVPVHLLAGMWLQLGQAVSGNVKLSKCDVCPRWFTYGTGTGQRKSKRYCSDRCRKAAHRQEKEVKK